MKCIDFIHHNVYDYDSETATVKNHGYTQFSTYEWALKDHRTQIH